MKLKSKAPIAIRPVREHELDRIMEWRMRPDITKYLFSDPKLTKEGQKKWFEAQKEDSCNYSFMIEIEHTPSGILTVTDVDRKNKRCCWGIYIAEQQKRSLERMLRIELSMYDFILCSLSFHKLWGEVFSFNRAVIRMHQMCGSRIEGTLKDHIYKNGGFYDVTVVGICREEWLQKREQFEYLPADMSAVKI